MAASRWFRFRLRTLLIAMAVVAAPLGWAARWVSGFQVEQQALGRIPDAASSFDTSVSQDLKPVLSVG